MSERRTLEEVMGRLAEQQVRHENGCLLWTGYVSKPTKNVNCDGHGKIKLGGKMVSVHRLIYSVKVGAIPEGMDVLRSCGNTRCGEPTHFFLGTYVDHIMAKIERGRAAKKLTLSQVQEIKRRYWTGTTQKEIANMFGVRAPMVSRIVNGLRWAHSAREV